MKCLIIEDDTILLGSLSVCLREWGATVLTAVSLAEGLARLSEHPELIIFDIRLPDGSGVRVAEAAVLLKPLPAMVAISGEASGPEGFDLARFGVLGYLEKPLSLTDFTRTLEALLSRAPDIVPATAVLVGRAPFQDLMAKMRRAMVEQALALSGGNRTTAARLLGVSRQAVQQQIRDLDVVLPGRSEEPPKQ